MASSYINSIKWGGGAVVVNFLRQVLLVPVFLSTVGESIYAFWIIIQTVAMMVRSINLGQLNYTSNLINLSYHVKGVDVEDDLSRGQSANIILVLFQIVVGLFLAFPSVLSQYSNFSLFEIYDRSFHYAVFFLILSTILVQYTSLFVLRLLEPVGKINLTIKYQVIIEFVMFVVTSITILLSKNILLTCFMLFVSSVFCFVLFYLLIKNKLPFRLMLFSDFSFFQGFEVIKKSFVLTVSFLIEKIHEIGLNLFVAKLYSNSVLTTFSTNRVVSNTAIKGSNIITIPLLPNIQKQFALNDKLAIVQKMNKFWLITTPIVVLFIVFLLPFVERLFNIWTKGKIEYNEQLMVFIFIAIVFQNFSTIISEFIKKTNLSNYILLYNSLKVGVILVSFYFFSKCNYVAGLGVSLFLGEFVSLFVIVYFLCKNVLTEGFLFSFMKNISLVICFSISLLCYVLFNDYITLILANVFFLIVFNLKKIRNVFSL